MVRIGILASGTGSNFDALQKAIASHQLKAEIACVVSDQESAPVLAKARSLGIDSQFIPFGKSGSEIQNYMDYLEKKNIDVIVLAGFMRILPPQFISRFPKTVNVHPSLLPAFPGLNGYEQAFEYGVKIAGVTIHLVDEKLDHGPILAQRSFSIEGCQSAREVRELGLKIEHELYAETLNWMLHEKFVIEGRRCVRSR